MSRSAFASRFRRVVGKTPLDHLTEWRMAHAARLIRDSQDIKLDSIAQSVGYARGRPGQTGGYAAVIEGVCLAD
jgi:AraC-like DNA-binding protein